MNREKRYEIFSRLQAVNPAPTTELEYETGFQLLVAVILSAQATDVSVNKATSGLFQEAPTPAAMLDLGADGLKRHISSIGLYNSKSENLLKTCEVLINEHGGEVPRERAALEALPGVGRKTANVILNTLFGEPVIAVDTHIFRISNRIRLARGKTVREVEDKLTRHTPKEFLPDAHHHLILHGRYVCTARNPKCGECCIRDLCEYPERLM